MECDHLAMQFEEEFERIGSITNGFTQMFNKLLELMDITKEEFIEEVGLSGDTFDNYVNGQGDPSLRSVTAFCLAFEIDNNSFLELLRAGGYSINFKRKKDCAYAFLMTHCMGMSLTECNEVLRKIGLSEHDLLPIPNRNEK